MRYGTIWIDCGVIISSIEKCYKLSCKNGIDVILPKRVDNLSKIILNIAWKLIYKCTAYICYIYKLNDLFIIYNT